MDASASALGDHKSPPTLQDPMPEIATLPSLTPTTDARCQKKYCECFQNGALDDGALTEPGAHREKEMAQSPKEMLAAYRTRVYNINPRFLEERQERAERRFAEQQETLLRMQEYVAESAEQAEEETKEGG